jgi:hypothetical protein
MMEVLLQSETDRPTPGVLHQGKGTDNYTSDEANDEGSKDDKDDRVWDHGDTPPIRNSTIMLVATERMSPQIILRPGLSHGLRLWS